MAFGLLACALALQATASLGAPINYGDFGPDYPPGILMYQGVTESSGTDPVPPGRFGPPTITADTLDFDPIEFVATASAGGLDITDGQLNFTLMSLPLTGVTSLELSEEGDYTLLGAGTALTQVAAGVTIFVDILEVDGVLLPTPLSVNATASFMANLPDDGPAIVTPWGASLVVDFTAILNSHEIAYEWGVSKAEIVIDNQLVAISELNSLAFISKKDFRIMPSVIIDPEFVLPEPASMTMMILGLVGFGVAFRRRLWPVKAR